MCKPMAIVNEGEKTTWTNEAFWLAVNRYVVADFISVWLLLPAHFDTYLALQVISMKVF